MMQAVLVIIAVLVVGFFAIGTVWNVRRGSAILRWMQGGLPLLGEKTTVRWLGSSAIEMVIRQARAPFEQVTLVVFLEPRDIPWMWAISRARGRRDTIIVRGVLRRSPKEEFEGIDPSSWSGRDAARQLGSDAWSTREPAISGRLRVYYQGSGVVSRADELIQRSEQAGLSVRRLSIRRTEPHFQLHVAPPDPQFSARQFFEQVIALGSIPPRAG